MVISKLKTILRPIKRTSPKHRFLLDVSGVVHVGANSGQERQLYDRHGLRVVWVEPNPEVFIDLERNIAGFGDQRAVQALVTDVDGKEYEFNIANNNGESSSILHLKQHKDIWPDVDFTSTTVLKSTTLPTLFEQEGIEPCDYQALIMDTQGSELLVLQGSVPILENFTYIKTEVPDFASYEGCCQLVDISAFMETHGYEEVSRHKFASRKGIGNYFDVTYKKR